MEEETLAEDTEPFEEETNEELNMIATNEELNLNDVIDDTDFLECDGEDGNSIQQFKPVCSDGWELDETGYHYVLDENRMMMDTMDLMNMELCIPKNGSIHHQEFGTMLLHQENLQLAM